MRSLSWGIRLLAVTLFLLPPCKTLAQCETILVVTGSSMPEPLYRAWADEYHRQNPSVQFLKWIYASGQVVVERLG